MIRNRFLTAALLAPLVAALPFLFFMWPLSDSPQWNLLIIFLCVFISYLATFLFGIPVTIYLNRKNLLNLKNLVFSGSVLGVLVFGLSLFGLSALLQSSGGFSLISIAWGAGFGFLVSLAFGLIAGITRC
jgi:hypothetical protein